MKHEPFHHRLLDLKEGSYKVNYHNRSYLVSKSTQLQGKLIKLYAQELGGNNFISLNYYPHIKDGLLKPCEMPEEKVIDFIINLCTFKS